MPHPDRSDKNTLRLNTFDKCCAVLAFLLGIIFVVFGVIGCFAGVNLNLSLPPVLGGLVFVVGWGIVKPIVVAWKHSTPDEQDVLKKVRAFRALRAKYLDPDDMITYDVPCAQCKYNLRGLSEYGVCPECGFTIADSLDQDMVRRIEQQ
jgi:hypothetical protein